MRLLEGTMKYLEAFNMVAGNHMFSVGHYLVRAGERKLELGRLEGSRVSPQENEFTWVVDIPSQGGLGQGGGGGREASCRCQRRSRTGCRTFGCWI
jgi:hypothetical protein